MTTGMQKNRSSLPPGNAPARRSFMSVSGRNVVLSAVKRSETEHALVVRLFNPSEEETLASIQLPFIPKAVRLTGLDELSSPGEGPVVSKIVQKGDQVQVVLPRKKIITLRLERE